MKYETRNAQKVLVGAMIYLVIGLAPVAAQTRQQPQVKVPNSTSSGEPSNTPTIIVSADQDYRIGPRDVIEVRIEDASELSDTYQINADGTFLMPYLKRVKAQDKTPEELSSFIAEYTLKTVNISGLFKGRFDQNAYVEPGDIVNIPQADVFFVAGEVNAPGSFPLSDGTTLRQAIALSQGTTFNAALGNGVIFRQDAATGKRQEIAVDIGAVMKGRKEDIPIAANDIVIVPNSRAKTIGNSILQAFGMGAAQRGVIPF